MRLAARRKATREVRYCRYEADSFPKSEFFLDDEWGLVHDTDTPHSILGTPLNVEWEFEYPVII